MPIRGTCGNATAAYVGIAASDVFTDLLVVLLPQPVIWKLYLPIGTKLGISGIICVGLLSIGMGVARLVGMLQTDFNNYTIATKDDYWAVIEIATAIFTCCGPALQPLVRQWAAFRSQNSSKPKLSGSSFAKHSNKKGSSKPSQYDDFVGDDLPLSSFGVHNEINCPPHGDALSAAEANIESPSGSLQRTDGAPSLSKGIVVEKSWTTY
ncbi:hypothetical protein KEM55_003281 [Ascosphaera atra]|nr:hypothetical protein KEM55_003281 [Ascosphaera atra]